MRHPPPICLPSGDLNPDFLTDLGERANRVAVIHANARDAFELSESTLAALLEAIDECEDGDVLMARRANMDARDPVWQGKHGRITFNLIVTAFEEQILELQDVPSTQ